MKFQFIERQHSAHSVGLMAELFGVSRGGFYAWRSRPASKRSLTDKGLVEEIVKIQEKVKYTYGSPRVSEALRRSGYRVGENRVARLMRESKLGRRAKKRYRSTTDSNHRHLVSENLLQREFDVPEPNLVWASDMSYVATAQGWLYLCVILDLFSRKVIGWAMGTRMTSELMIRALLMACMNRKPPEGVIFHSDRGSQYCSEEFRKHLGRYRMRQSMSRVADPWDNAVVESFFKTLKGELCGDRAFVSRAEARTALFEYLEVFYNRNRLHSTLDYQTPEEYEEDFARKAA